MMASTMDRRTWTCVGAPPAARLRIAQPTTRRAMLDGAWWPGSRDPVLELFALVGALNVDHGPVERVMLQPAAWDWHPRRLLVDGRVVRLGWFTTLDAALVIVTGAGDLRVDLLVIPPQTPLALATAAMVTASRADNTARAGRLLAGPSIPEPRQPEAEEAWETEGGHLRAERKSTAPARA